MPFNEAEKFAESLLNPKPATAAEELAGNLLGPVQTGVPQPAPPDVAVEEPSMLFGEFGRGIKAGARQVKTDFLALGAVGANIFDANESEERLIKLIGERRRESEIQNPRTVQKIEDIDNVEDFARFTARALGEQVPIIASIIAGGGAGGLAGRLIAKGVASRIGVTAALTKIPKIGAGVGAVATASGLETGVTAEEQLGSIGHIEPDVALIAGTLKGSLEALVPAALGARFGLTPDLTRGLIGKMITTFEKVLPRRLALAPALGVSEGLTEGLQEIVDISARDFVDENFDAISEESKSRLLNAAATGGLVGMVFGPLLGGGGALRADPSIRAEVNQEEDVIAAEAVGEAEALAQALLTGPIAPTQLETPAATPLLPGAAPQLQLTDQSAPAGPITPTEGVTFTPEGTLGLGQGQINAGVDPLALPLEVQVENKTATIIQQEAEQPAVEAAQPEAGVQFTPGQEGQPNNLKIRYGPDGKELDINYRKKDSYGQQAIEPALGVAEVGEPTFNGFVTDEEFAAQTEGVDFGPTADQRLGREGQTGDSFASPQTVVGNRILEPLQRPGTYIINNNVAEQVDPTNDKAIRDYFEADLAKGDRVRTLLHVQPVNKKKDKERVQNLGFRAEAIQKVYKNFLDEFNIDSNVTLLAHDGFLNDNKGEYFAGQGTDDVIYVDVNKPGWELTAIHEFGHLLVSRRFFNAPQALKEQVLEGYNKRLARTEIEGIPGLLTDFTGLGRAGEFVSTIESTSAERVTKGVFERQKDYWLGFDEYMAEQAVRATVSDVKALDRVSKYFIDLGAILKKYFNTVLNYLVKVAPPGSAKQYADRARNIRPEREYADFLDYIRNNPTSHEEVYQQSQAASAQANRSTLQRMGVIGQQSRDFQPEQAATANVKTLLKKLKIPEKQVDEVTAPADRYNGYIKVMWTLQQTALKNLQIKPLQRYVEHVDQWYIFHMNWMSKANDRLRNWMSLGESQGEALTKFIFEVESLSYLTANDFAPRQPTDAEIATIAKKHKLSAPGIEVYRGIVTDFAEVFNQIEQTTIRDIERTVRSLDKRAEKIATVREEFDARRAQPYFPHTGFGDYAIVIRDEHGKTIYLEQFEKVGHARAALKSRAADYPEGKAIVREVPKNVKVFRGLPATTLEAIRDRLSLSEEQQGWLDDFLSELAQSSGLKKTYAKRAGIPGYSLNAMRSYANYFFYISRHLARIEYGPLLEIEIANLTQENSEAAHLTDISKRDAIRNNMIGHYDYVMNPRSEWATLRSGAFMMWMGANLSSAVVNFTQIPLVALPYLSARFGDVKTIGALQRATFQLHNLYNNKPGKLSDSFVSALSRAHTEGVVTESMAAELAAIAGGGYISRLLPGPKAARRVIQFSQYAAWMFQTSEKINRRIVFRAAWNLADKNPQAKYIDELIATKELLYADLIADGLSATEARSYLVAKDAVERTQFRYAAHARPEFMRGKKGTLFTFFMFVQNMVWFAGNSPGNKRFLLMMLLMGGLMGLPFAQDIAAVVRFIARNIFGKDFNIDKEVREFVVELLGDEIPPDLILFGTSRYGFGMPALMDVLGLPKANFDMSANIGMGQIIPGLAQFGPPGQDHDAMLSRIGTDISGAAFGIGLNTFKALTDTGLPADDFKRWERAFPRALRNLSKSIRYAREGRERTRSGATVAEFDISDPDHMAEIIAQGLGFTPTRLSQRWDRETMQRESEAFWMTQRQMLMLRFDQSFVLSDPAMRKSTLEDIKGYNKKVPFGLMRIKSKDIVNSRKQRLRQRRLFEAGISQHRKSRPLSHKIDKLFPELDIQDVKGLESK